MEDLQIKKMEYDDIDRILQIEELSYGEHHWSKDSFIAELNNKISSYFCILLDNVCVGYIGFWKIIDEAHVTNLSIHPEYRKRGLGQRLLLKMVEECYKEKIKYITLEVRESNEKAIKLYEKFGFKSLGIRKNYYQDNNESALIMWSENIFDKKYKELYDKIKSDLG